jgi:hypothetical protein
MHDKNTLNELFSKKKLTWRDIQHVDFTHLPADIIQNKNARQVIWHMLNPGIIKFECMHDACDNNVPWKLSPKEYSTHRAGYKDYCSHACAINSDSCKQKRAQTNLVRFGSENVFQSPVIKQKIKDHFLDKYHVDNPAKVPEIAQQRADTFKHRVQTQAGYLDDIVDKRRQTTTERYGVDNIAKLPQIQEQKKFNFMNAHGVEHHAQLPEIRAKTQATLIERYGHAHTFQSPEVCAKIRATMQERYGVEHSSQHPESIAKTKTTMQERYGVTYFPQRHIPADIMALLDDELKFVEFVTGKGIIESSRILMVDKTTISSRIQRYDCASVMVTNHSYLENEMSAFLQHASIPYQQGIRSIIAPLELDFFCEQHGIAIEMNGDYWHCDHVRQNPEYHFEKWQRCDQLGIRLIQISETDWCDKNQLVKNMLLTAFGKTSLQGSIGARKFKIECIDSKSAMEFVEQYHLQGGLRGSTHNYGAFLNGTLRAVMSYGWTRGKKQHRRFELKRWVTDNQHSYPGLFSKTFKFSLSDHSHDEIVSWSMNDWFTGNVYAQCGWEFIKVIKPSYRYFVESKGRHKSYLTKEKIVMRYGDKYPEIKQWILDGATERQLTEYLMIPRIWDSGKREWQWKEQSNQTPRD